MTIVYQRKLIIVTEINIVHVHFYRRIKLHFLTKNVYSLGLENNIKKNDFVE